jgi:membrane protease subunit HflK
VVNAGQDAETAVNQATGYLNQVVPEARGDAARIVQGAEGYREQVVADATGEAARFVSVLTEYERAPQVTRERLYLETLERLLARSDKIMLDPDAGNGVVPYLPLDQLTQSSTQGAQQ